MYNNDYRYIFLHDDQSRRSLAHLNSLFGRILIISAVCDFAVSVILTLALDSIAGENPAYIAIPFVCGAGFFVGLAATSIVMSVKSKMVLEESFSKLTQTPKDNLKRQLHNLYIGFRRMGNIMFIAILAAGVIAGIIIAVIGYNLSKDSSPLFTLMMADIGVSLLVAIAAAFVIWSIMFYIYRRKARPFERELTFMSFEECDAQ